MKKARKLMAATLATSLAVSLALLPADALARSGYGKGSDTEQSGKSKGADLEKKRGLYRALERVKDTPAEETISNLLSSKYEVEEIIDSLDELTGSEDPAELTGETVPGDEEVEAVTSEIRKGHKEGKYRLGYEDLTQLADVYDQLEKPEESIDTQEEAIAENPVNLEGYKKLGKLKKKAGKKGLEAFVNGEAVPSDVQPLFVRGRAMVPFRAISAALKATVEYKEDGTVVVSKDGVTIELKAGSTTALVNGEEFQLSVAPVVKNNRVFVPFRFIGEAFAMNVDYEPESGSVIVNDPAEPTDDASTSDGADSPTGTETEGSADPATDPAADTATPEPTASPAQ